MSQFDFFLAFYSLVLGLGVAQLLSGFGNLLRETPTPRLGLITPLLGLLLMIELLSNFVCAWHKFDTIPVTLPGLVLPTLVGVAYYLTATIVTPVNFGEWQTLDEYFDRRQRWIVGLMLLANILVGLIALQHPERTNWRRRQWKLSAPCIDPGVAVRQLSNIAAVDTPLAVWGFDSRFLPLHFCVPGIHRAGWETRLTREK